jgi:hypothetical protein
MSIESIWNTALIHLGEATVASTSETSANATLLNTVWDDFFEEFLTDHPWSGANTTATLSTLVDSASATVTPPTRWSYAYALPSDFLQVLGVNSMARQAVTDVQYELGTILVDGVRTRALFTNTSTAELWYIADIGNQITLLSPKVRAACGLMLAARIAPSFGKSENEVQALLARGEATLADARALSSMQNTPRFFPETPLLASRKRYRGRGRS